MALMARSQILQSFVARIWLERTDDEDPRWRGHIQHIQGPEETYFQDLAEMSDFMEQVSGVTGAVNTEYPDKVVKMKKRDRGGGKKSIRKNRDD